MMIKLDKAKSKLLERQQELEEVSFNVRIVR